jgi:hypothetical protein
MPEQKDIQQIAKEVRQRMQSDVFAEKILSSAANHGQPFWQSVHTAIIAACKDKIVIYPDKEDLADKVIAEIRQTLQEEKNREAQGELSESNSRRETFSLKERILPRPWEYKDRSPGNGPSVPNSFLR